MATTPNSILAVTPYGVAVVTPITRVELDRVGLWFCNNYCAAGVSMGEAEWDRQRQQNGGYCNPCRDLAGSFLSEFTIIPVEVQ